VGWLAKGVSSGDRPAIIVVVLIGIISECAEDPHPGHFEKRMPDLRLIAGIVEGGRELLSVPQPGRRFHHHRFFTEK
jgi:hypothetical protein